jgi:serine/threonine protein kinase
MTTATRPKSDSRAAELADLVERLTARIQAREPIDFDAVRREHPQHADELERLIPALALLADFSRSPGAAVIGEGDSEFGTLGDFRLIREVGRGGMGIVYEAEQISLNRNVALKVLPFAATMDPRHLQRFRNEAQAAACLHHPNIVPVYGVGCDRGVHYYAMQLIEGQTLAEVISDCGLRIAESKNPSPGPSPKRRGEEELDVGRAEALRSPRGEPIAGLEDSARSTASGFLPSPPASGGEGMGVRGDRRSTVPNALLSTKRDRAHFRHIATLIASAADALEYAHSMGVVHRDIKPGNLMLDFSPSPLVGEGRGGGAHLWITDFGLAKLANPGREPGGELTLTGDLLGTLRYMSPEQALAKHGLVDHRTDIYSLGATLYELLTLKPAVAGNDKAEILKSIAWDEPTPLRKHDKSIPAELETITLKCLAKEPSERYATAGELAEDLRRWLGDRTIKARPPGWREKAAKWGRRHKGFVTGAVAALAIATLMLSLSTYLIWQKEKQVRDARDEESTQRLRATQLLNQTYDVVNDMYSEVAALWLEDEPHMTPVQRTFLDRAVKYFEQLANEPNPDNKAHLYRAYSLSRLGTLYVKVNQFDKALQALEQSIAILEEVHLQHPGNTQVKADLASSHHNLGTLHFEFRNQPAMAEPLLRHAVRLRESLVQDNSADLERCRELATSYNMLGLTLGPKIEAEHFLQKGVELTSRLLTRSSDPKYFATASVALDSLARYRTFQKNHGEAIELLEKAIGYVSVAVKAHPRKRAWRSFLANSHDNIARVYSFENNWEKQLPHAREALQIRRLLAADYPEVDQYASRLADSMVALALNLYRHGNIDEAQSLAQESLHRIDDLVERSAAESNVEAQGNVLASIGWLYLKLGRLTLAQETLNRAVDIKRKLASKTTPTSNKLTALSGAATNLAITLIRQGKVIEALPFLENALELQEQAATAPLPKHPRFHEFLRSQKATLAIALTHAAEGGNGERALKLANEAVKLDAKHGEPHRARGIVLYRLGNYTAAIDSLQRGLESGKDDLEIPDSLLVLSMAYQRLGDPVRGFLCFVAGVSTMAQLQPANEDTRTQQLRDEAASLIGVNQRREQSTAGQEQRKP